MVSVITYDKRTSVSANKRKLLIKATIKKMELEKQIAELQSDLAVIEAYLEKEMAKNKVKEILVTNHL